MFKLQDAMRWIGDPALYKNFAQPLNQVKNNRADVFKICQAAIIQSIESPQCKLTQKMHAIRLLKEIIQSGALQLIDQIDGKISKHFKRILELKTPQTLFIDLQKRADSQQTRTLGTSYFTFIKQCVWKWAQWLKEFQQENSDQNVWAQLKAYLVSKAVETPKKYSYFKDEDYKKFLANANWWIQNFQASQSSKSQKAPAQPAKQPTTVSTTIVKQIKPSQEEQLLRQKISAFQIQINQLTKKLQIQQKKMGSQKSVFQSQKLQWQKQKQQLSAQLKSLQQSLKAGQSKITDIQYNKLNKQYQQSLAQLNKIRTQLTTARSQFKSSQKIFQNQITALKAELNSQKRRQENLNQQIIFHKSNQQNLTKELRQLAEQSGVKEVIIQKQVRDLNDIQTIKSLQKKLYEIQANIIKSPRQEPLRKSPRQEDQLAYRKNNLQTYSSPPQQYKLKVKRSQKPNFQQQTKGYPVQFQINFQKNLFHPLKSTMMDLRKAMITRRGFFYQSQILKLHFSSENRKGSLSAMLTIINNSPLSAKVSAKYHSHRHYLVEGRNLNLVEIGSKCQINSDVLISPEIPSYQPVMITVQVNKTCLYAAIPVNFLNFCQFLPVAGNSYECQIFAKYRLSRMISLQNLGRIWLNQSQPLQRMKVVYGSIGTEVHMDESQIKVSSLLKDRDFAEILLQNLTFLLSD